jgi:hypothetical protein
MATAEKIDLMKLHREEYAPLKKPALIEVKPARYLAITGMGVPGGEEFQACLGALYNMAYTIKMARKSAGKQDYKVATLEGLWWNAPGGKWRQDVPQEKWSWRLMIRTPDFIKEKDLQEALEKLEARKKPLVEKVRLEEIEEGKSVQMLHVGPYMEEAPTIRAMLDFADANGVRPNGKHHEIYLSDPRRVKPEKLRTILRIPVR